VKPAASSNARIETWSRSTYSGGFIQNPTGASDASAVGFRLSQSMRSP
jgi:hypothetical protein